MAQTDMLKRYLDAGVAFAQMTQERAEAIVRDLVGAGEVGAEQASSQVQELVERSRENTERLLETVRAEINAQIGNLGLATRDDIEALRREIAELRAASSSSSASSSTATPATGGSSVPPSPTKKAPAKKASGVPDPGTKAAPTKAPAKKKQASAVAVPGTKAPAAAKAPAAKKTAKKASPAKRS